MKQVRKAREERAAATMETWLGGAGKSVPAPCKLDLARGKRVLSSAGGGNPNWGSAEVQVFGMIFIASMCFG